MKLPVELLSQAEGEYPASPADIQKVRTRIAESTALELDGPEFVEDRRAVIAAASREELDIAFERYIGTNDLLPVNYLLGGVLRSRAVGRIRYHDKREGKTATATGFMVSPDLMLTNFHVFPAADLAAFKAIALDPVIEFGYEFDLGGRRSEPAVFDLAPEAFLHTSRALDMALVAVRRSDRAGRRSLGEQGYLVLSGEIATAGLGDFATIIQHPDGREKQISLRNNDILDVTKPDVIIYQSDTAQGSSGAPVFNNEWQVIALHSAGVALKNDQGEYVDKDGQPIPVVGGRIDETRVVWQSNRGIRISAIVRHLKDAPSDVRLHPMVQALFSPAYTDSRPFEAMPVLPAGGESRLLPAAAPAAAPSAASVAPIRIQISIGGGSEAGAPRVSTSVFSADPLDAGLEQEKKYEDELDFSQCAGFQEEFMGERIAMPVPTPKLRKQLAFRLDNPSAFTLKYHHISALHHAVRRVPVVSAINVNAKRRYAELDVEGSRKDKWFRDNRIDYDAQLDDAWYAKSGFDRGHLARREDAEWGTSVAHAKQAADLTCSYANAIPQVPALNRAKFGARGLWGRLELKLLEEGVENESGKAARICVFNGPLFSADDPVFKAVQVAMDCYKVVVWYDGKGKLRTTCFRLSQVDLVGEIEFEALKFDKIFKTYQVGLDEIEGITGLVFAARLHQTDTFTGHQDFVHEVLKEDGLKTR